MKYDIDEVTKAWKQTTDSDVIMAATEDWEEYPEHVQEIIKTEAQNRGFWQQVLNFRNQNEKRLISEGGNSEDYVCPVCHGTDLNHETGRCSVCGLPSENMGYCILCGKFYPLFPGKLCPEHNIKLSRYKAAMALHRLGNYYIDYAIYSFVLFIIYALISIETIDSQSHQNVYTEEFYTFLSIVIGAGLFFFYYIFFEVVFQRTPAKFVTGTKVVTATGEKPSVGAIIKRTLIRLVPFEPFSFLGEKVYGWHDRWSKTYVIRAKRFEIKE